MAPRPEVLADGMTAWLHGEETEEAEAASRVLAELASRGLLYLRAIEEAAKKDVRTK